MKDRLSPSSPARPPPDAPPPVLPYGIGAGALVVLGLGWALLHHAESRVNTVALAAAPKPVTAVVAARVTFRDTHAYVGTLRPWVEASVGPQFVSAYVATVLVRPGAAVKRNEVLATLDCRNTSAASVAVAAEARAIDARQKAVADESARVHSLLDGGFVSPNEAEQKEAQSTSEQAQLAAQRAKLTVTGLAVDDCILRAPFDGEISLRSIDPGAFVRPGAAIVTLVDRNTVRLTFDVPETDFDAVAPGSSVSIHALATDQKITGAIARRSPAADPDTRTVRVEVDLDDAHREIPVNTTGEVHVAVGLPRPAIAVPLMAASVTGSRATLFVLDGDVVRKKTFSVLGEEGNLLYVDTSLPAGSRVVTEGRSLLADGDRVSAKEAASGETASSSQPTSPQETTP